MPESLGRLNCSNNGLVEIPSLPNLYYLNCNNTSLMALPALPESLIWLHCNNNQHLLCLPFLPMNLDSLGCANTGVSCLPNYTNSNYINPILPLCDEVQNTYCNTISTTNNLESNMQVLVYPNPFQDFIMIELEKNNSSITFSLLNSNGAIVFEKIIDSSNKMAIVDATGLPKGVYMYCLKSDGKILNSGKLITE